MDRASRCDRPERSGCRLALARQLVTRTQAQAMLPVPLAVTWPVDSNCKCNKTENLRPQPATTTLTVTVAVTAAAASHTDKSASHGPVTVSESRNVSGGESETPVISDPSHWQSVTRTRDSGMARAYQTQVCQCAFES